MTSKQVSGMLLGLLVVLVVLAQDEPRAQDGALAPELRAVRKHILEADYPERFLATVYQARIEHLLLTDLDRDGQAEVIALMKPHYRQSAPIVIYRVAKDLTVSRVREGLAPGPLVAVSGRYLDSHTLGEAADVMIGGSPPLDRDKALAAFFRSGFGGVVEYRTFFHADARGGEGAYIDMRHADPPGGAQTCGAFEFARVEAIAVGGLEPEPTRTYLAARVASEIWLYHVSAVLPDGLLRKTIRVERLPGDFAGFAPGTPRVLSYQTRSGDVRSLRFVAR